VTDSHQNFKESLFDIFKYSNYNNILEDYQTFSFFGKVPSNHNIAGTKKTVAVK
jgi:hypothetical protein